MAAKPARLEGRLTIKAPTTLMGLYLGDMLNKFQQCHRGIDMDVVVLDRPVNPVLEGFDVAIGMWPAAITACIC